MFSRQMASASRRKENKIEKATELFRLHLERSGTMDALAGWIRKALEVPDEDRPDDVLTHLKEHWSPYNGNISMRAIKNMMKNVQEELSAELEKRKELERKIAHLENMLLKKKVAALNVSASHKAVVKTSSALAPKNVSENPADSPNMKSDPNTSHISCASWQFIPCYSANKLPGMNAPMNPELSYPAVPYFIVPFAPEVNF